MKYIALSALLFITPAIASKVPECKTEDYSAFAEVYKTSIDICDFTINAIGASAIKTNDCVKFIELFLSDTNQEILEILEKVVTIYPDQPSYEVAEKLPDCADEIAVSQLYPKSSKLYKKIDLYL